MSAQKNRHTGSPRGRPVIIGPHLSWGARLRAYFLAGILVTAPLSITLYLAWLFINFIDNRVASLLPERFHPETYLPFGVPGIGVLVVVLFLILIGWMAAGYMGRMMLRSSENILARIPAVRTIYGAVKQILETVLAKQSSAFREVVLIEYPRRGIWAVGFITGTSQAQIQELTDDSMVNIFLPTTPNPTSGFLLFVPNRDVIRLNISIEEGIKLVVSAGIVVPSQAGDTAPQPLPAPVTPAAKTRGRRVAARAAGQPERR